MRSAETPRSALADAELERLLADDAPHGDLTTEALGIGGRHAGIEFRARQAMTVCATEEAARMFELRGCAVHRVLASGSGAAAASLVLEARGHAAAIHRVWKVAQTLVEYASGIASATARMVAALRDAGYETPVACTRKSFPGTKAIAVKAVICGGGIMHRLGLSETLLVFPEHRVFVAEARLAEAFAMLRRRCPEKKLVAEVDSIEDALWLAARGVDVLQLEKFAPLQVAACKRALDERYPAVVLAAAGGVDETNAIDYAAAGADLLVTSAPYFARPADVQVNISSLEALAAL